MAPSFQRDSADSPRFAQPATFMRLPHQTDLRGVDVAIMGVPFDSGTSYRSGARHGPREIRSQSSLIRPYSYFQKISPFERLTVVDAGDVNAPPVGIEPAYLAIEAAVDAVIAAGAVPMMVGGDHSISLPILRAIAASRPVGMVHFDAHCDTGSNYLGSNYHHGAPFARAVEEGLLDPGRTVQIGIRGGINDREVWRFSHESGMRVIYMPEFHEMGWQAAIAEARRVVGDGPTYVSFDIDSLDPAYAPGTGTPEIGGFTSLEVQLMIRALRGLDLVGADVVEVSPPFDPSGLTALTGASMMFELLCVLADARAARRG